MQREKLRDHYLAQGNFHIQIGVAGDLTCDFYIGI